jgi:hypothetical protein
LRVEGRGLRVEGRGSRVEEEVACPLQSGWKKRGGREKEGEGEIMVTKCGGFWQRINDLLTACPQG